MNSDSNSDQSDSSSSSIKTETKKKEIKIIGKTSRYLMKKLIEEKNSPVKRKQVEKWNVDPTWFQTNIQLDLLSNDEPILRDEIAKKISSYRQQDVLKKRLNKKELIDYQYVKSLIQECALKCHYCSEDSLILYETRRDMSQWTVDRIDNEIGHNRNNIVISCLKCNLQRKSRNSDKFLQTKQMVIKRENYKEIEGNHEDK